MLEDDGAEEPEGVSDEVVDEVVVVGPDVPLESRAPSLLFSELAAPCLEQKV